MAVSYCSWQCLISRYSKINLLYSQTSMLYLSKPKQERQFTFSKSATDITSSPSSTTSLPREISNNSKILQLRPNQQPQRVLLEDGTQTYSLRINSENIPPRQECVLSSSRQQTEQLKSVNLKRIVDSVMELKRGLLLYRYLERDEESCKRTVYYWFRETEAAFLNCLNGPVNVPAAEGLLQEEKKIRSSRMIIVPSGQENLPVNFSYGTKPNEALLNKEVQRLKQEIEAYRRDSVEALQKLQLIMKMMKEVRDKQEAQKRQREAERTEKEFLIATLRSYVKQSDQIVQKIAAKQKAQGKVTLIEQLTSQVLAKFKFKAYATSAI